MKSILFVSPDPGKKPSFSYSCKKGLKEEGYEVHSFDYRLYQLHRVNFSNNLVNKFLLKTALKINPDYVVVMKGETINKGIIQKISDAKIKTACWTLDDPFGDFNKSNNIKNINEYDAFFVFDPFYLKKLKKTGQENSYYLPCAADPAVYKEVVPINSRKYFSDVSFVGTHQKNREKILNKLKEYNTNIWGYHWNNRRNKSELNIKKRLYKGNKKYKDTLKICEIYNRSKINLNIHFPHSIESVNLRTFEIPATKSFQLTDHYKDLPNLFKLKKEIVSYHDVSELKELINYYLDNEDERNKIALAGHKRVLKEHTQKHRIINLIKKLN